ncbi:hypothetical protein D0N36_19305 [Hymenobacter lapidiphilus]|uniref:hypothetical protein n=1 Tax=Hymenobacter sp. CCM 8763 TaxID=2303334 RepID=UPI000E347F34|nr:hypothetical protein [Hymenobacter sp. CCM 8763]RFP63444.1 hypothetical protein D0N36_19305 [Hymenobacter sp. CCM 8763]
MRYLLPLFGASLLFTIAANAQSIDAQKVTFDYIRLPLVPVPAGTSSYTPEVVLRYVESVKQQQSDHVSAVAEAKAKAEKDKQEYKAQSLKEKAMNRLLLDERKPGEAVIPTADYTAQVYDAPTLAATYLSLSGMQRAQNAGDLRVTVTLDGFTQGPITPIQVKGTSLSVGGASTGDGIKHAYEVSYKSPISVKVTTKEGKVLLDEMLESTNTYTIGKTEAFATEEGLNKFWRNNQGAFMRQLDEDAMKTNMKLVTDYLDSALGKRAITRNTSVWVVSDKKVNYDEFPQAYEKALVGYKLLADPTRTLDANKQITDAVVVWNKVLAESNPKDKKARIDEKVTAATLYNTAEANMWLNNFDETDRLLARLKLLDIPRYNMLAKELDVVAQDQHKRFDANKKN